MTFRTRLGSNLSLNFREKRKILFGSNTTAQELLETGRKFMQAERFDDAVEFFAMAQATQEVQKIAGLALEQGDTPLFLRAKVVLKEKPTEQELDTLARNAEAAGRSSMALTAYLKAGHEEQAERLRAEMGLSPHPEKSESSDSPPAHTGVRQKEKQ